MLLLMRKYLTGLDAKTMADREKYRNQIKVKLILQHGPPALVFTPVSQVNMYSLNEFFSPVISLFSAIIFLVCFDYQSPELFISALSARSLIFLCKQRLVLS